MLPVQEPPLAHRRSANFRMIPEGWGLKGVTSHKDPSSSSVCEPIPGSHTLLALPPGVRRAQSQPIVPPTAAQEGGAVPGCAEGSVGWVTE